jgi:hypothetical protein
MKWRRVPNDRAMRQRLNRKVQAKRLTGATGLEPAASGVTGRRSNQLSYAPEGVRRRGRRRYAG